ncbi:MAG: RlmE family RNA methyltransferase [Deltaproteobacteria bacterium]|nr:MAG: RlmE family RNA methyltransferase [Deltaproteobacteria bacterium]TMA76514.1 MAG: RlmE family RNA methyltransferase [Deltaproteobacteria bacterium]
MRDRRRDPYHRLARAEGFRARSAYKLAELDRRFGLLGRGDYVVELGAAPGGWLQIVLERVGPQGRAVGVDLTPITPLAAPNLYLLEADVREAATAQAILDHLGRHADVVLSDLAPKLTGVRARDETRSAALVETTLDLLPTLLRPGGRLLTKVFMGTDYEALLARLRRNFTEVKTTRAAATRPGSAELYAACIGHRYETGSRKPSR